MKATKAFHIRRKPIVPVAEDEKPHDLSNWLQVPRFHGPARLVAIPRDPSTIFAYWNVDWSSIFKNSTPIDRQVHLRIHCVDGLEEKETAVEPMAATHYLTLSQRHRICHLEIGYYQPADVWHSVAISNEITMPPTRISEAEQVDLATIPFHLGFQQLVELFGVADSDALATVISRFQTRALSSERDEALSLEQHKILDRTGVALSELAESRRVFDQINGEKLKTNAQLFLTSGSTSPSRRFKGDWISGGS